MSTAVGNVRNEIECHHDLHSFLCGLEDDPCLSPTERLQDRLGALDDLDARFGGFDSEKFASQTSSPIHGRAKALRARYEAANAELYQSVRSELLRDGQASTLLQLVHDSWSLNGSGSPLPGLGFDWQDELVSGVLQLSEPSKTNLYRSPEMVNYQPTPVRHVLHLIAGTVLSEDDVFVDLGSGLGHVPLLVSMLAQVQSIGIEVQAAYVASAHECAQNLRLNRVRFIAEDARAADLSTGTVFYLYSPFTGSILTDVLSMLREESTRRSITICSLGPCTCTVVKEQWLKTGSPPSTERIAVFTSQ